MSSVSRSTKYEPPSGSTTLVDAALVRDDLLRAQRQRRGFARSAAPAPRRASWCAASWCRRAPPASACSAVRTTLLYGCCAVSETPAVWVWKRSFHDRSSLAPKRSRITSAQSLRAARNLAISSKKSLCELKKNEMRGAKSSTSSPASTPVLHVLDAVAQRERQLLQRRRAGLADVIPAHRDRCSTAALPSRRTRRCR